MLHQNLSDHVFVVEPAHSAIRCRVCGFTLSDLAMNEFGISRDDLFFEDIPSDSGMPVNYDVISDTLKQKYIPAFSKQIYDSSALLAQMAEKKMKSDLEEDLFRQPVVPLLAEVSERVEKTVRNELGKQLFNNLDKLILKNDL